MRIATHSIFSPQLAISTQTIPTVLIVHTLDWPNAARLAMSLRAADCHVQGAWLDQYPMSDLAAVDRIHRLDPFSPIRSLQTAIEAADPDLVIPCDDRALSHLHQLHRESSACDQGSGLRVKAILERSLGWPLGYAMASKRSLLPELAAFAEVLIPRTDRVQSLREVHGWLDRHGLPAVLKTDYSWGGEGVAVIESHRQAEAAFRKLSSRPSLLRAAKRIIVNHDPSVFNRKYHDAAPTLSIQRFIEGTPANIAVTCWNGTVDAAISVEVITSTHRTGSATVVRPVQNPQMFETAKRIIHHLGISGCCGLDFVLEHSTGQAYMIEINPRATQIHHLVLDQGRDLPGVLRGRIAGTPPRFASPVTRSDIIALYPQEVTRDPHSKFLKTAYHDIPRGVSAAMAMH